MAGSIYFTGTANPKHGIHRLNALRASLNPELSTDQIVKAIDASETYKKVTEIGAAVTGLGTMVTGLETTVSEIAVSVSEENIINNVSAALSQNAVLAEIPNIAQTLQKIADAVTSGGDPNSETLSINPEYWDVLRKGLQLLNTLEDWVLADDFQEADTAKIKKKHATSGTNTEFLEVTYESLLHKFIALIKECQSLPISIIEEVENLFKPLHDSFPKKDDPANRADYYCKIIQARTELVRLFSTDSISTWVSNPPNNGTTGA
jgi:hypothetical protein